MRCARDGCAFRAQAGGALCGCHLPKSKEHKAKIASALKIVSVNRSEEHKRNLAASRKGQKNHQWKGGVSRYTLLHNWIRSVHPKTRRCERCGKNAQTHMANLSGEYHWDTADFQEMCISCHAKHDNWVQNFLSKDLVAAQATCGTLA